MQQKRTISNPKRGMNREISTSQLDNTSYNLAVNLNTNNEVEGFNVQLESSNRLSVNFPTNYVVIGFISDLLKERTYYFLTNPNSESDEFKRSSIGYVDNSTVLSTNYNDTFTNQDCIDCNPLPPPLEETTQTPSQQYVELLHDRCISDEDLEEKGLNFDVNFPIKKIEIKQEVLGTTLYWNDWRNPFRFLQIGRIEEALDNNTFDYLHTLDIACEDPTETPCLDVSKMLINPKHKRMVIEAQEEQIGGNLKQGTYEFRGAYCDLQGNEVTEYCTATNPISIWNENNFTQSQTETDDFTNYAIKLKIHNLDIERFKYYKIAAIERNNVNNTQSVFLVGIFPTTDNIVTYTHSGSSNDDLYLSRGNVSIKKRMDFSQLNAIKPSYKRMKGTMVSDDRLFGYGIEEEEEINIQPVVNLFSGLVKAQTSAVSENLYKSPVATSKYKQFTRNEVQPLGIRLIQDNGGYTPTFTFVGRPKTEDDAEIIEESNNNRASILEGDGYCTVTDRTEKWQIFNTASELEGQCFDLDENSIELPPQTLEKTCFVEIETLIPENSITLELEEDFYDLESYINDHIDEICVTGSIYYNEVLCDYLSSSYEEMCEPSYIGDCTEPDLVSSTNLIGEVIGEQTTFIEKCYKADPETSCTENEYRPSVPPEYCFSYKRSQTGEEYMEDEEFIYSSVGGCAEWSPEKIPVFIRDIRTNNESCVYAEDLTIQTNPTQPQAAVVMNYDASLVEADLITENSSFVTTITDTGFLGTIHNKAQFYRVVKNNRDKFVFEVTKRTNCDPLGDYLAQKNNKYIRYVIYDKCSSPTQLGGGIVDLDEGHLEVIDITTFPNTFFIVIDTKIISDNVKYDCDEPAEIVHFITPPCGCFSIYQRDIEYKAVNVSWESIIMNKKMVYEATCTTYLPKINDCEPIPYKKYKMAYWESTNDYTDNAELFDSSKLKINSTHLSELESIDREDFLEYFTEGVDSEDNYVLKETTDLRCQPIRHPKFPDNTVAPFMIDNISHKDMADSVIFPMGINFDSKIVQAMIEVAYDNGLLTKKQKESIVGWEIMRGDNTIHKSVISNGILIDVNKYTKGTNTVHYPNFPFNDLGENKFVKNPSTDNLIQHPFNGEKNNKFTFLSPDMFIKKTAIPTEMTIQGYMFGGANMNFANVEKHPQWTVLGEKTYQTANRLSRAEVALEIVIAAANGTKELTVGWTSINIGGVIAAALTAAAYGVQSFVKLGQYRYEWLTIFRDLGRMDNFASFQYGAGRHNRLLRIDQNDDNYLRRLSIRKHLEEGYYTIIDENDGSEIKINNKQREHSVFLATGQQFIEYPTDYINFDNNKVNSNSSNFLSSDINCEEKESKRDIANPYVSLKNYIPDQWDTVDSIKWLTTNYIFDLDDDTTCKTIYGGTQVISRFSWRTKVPLFNQNAIRLADKLPYLYSRSSNIGDTRFYCNYETANDTIFNFSGIAFPDIRSDYVFDCPTGRNDYYLRPPSKFYLFTHGIINFLVESEINCNFRYAKKQPHEQFYKNQDLATWLQEVNMSISEPNTFFYNGTYSFPVSNSQYRYLDRTYNRDIWRKRALKLNAWVWSEKDTNEDALVDPFLVFKPFNFHQDKTNRGELIDLRSIESGQFLGRYEDQLQLFNQSNNVADAINGQNIELGTGFLNARPISFKKADLGFAGTQNVELISTPYGHFWCDAKRGKVLQLDQNGGNLEIISEVIQGKPSGMKQWFREHLPFKILKYYPQADIDNKFKGLGLNMWWDDRESRLFITKRDYVPITPSAITFCDDFYRTTGYEDIIESYENDGYTYEGIENCSLKFTSGIIPTDTDIYAFFDTTSMQQVDGVSAAAALNTWFAQYQSNNPNFTGNLYIISTGNEDWLDYPNLLWEGTVSVTSGVWNTINILPPNLNTVDWVRPTNLIVLAFVDEANPRYHSSSVASGFGGASVQPTMAYQQHYTEFVDNYTNNFTFFKGVIYPIVQNTAGLGGALVLQALAAIEGTTLTAPQIAETNTTVDVSLLLTENPYSTLGGVKNYGWKGVYDKVSPASAVFNSSTFTEELNGLILEGGEGDTVYESLEKVEVTDTTYFKDVSWTIAYKPSEGTWNSYFTFYPDYSPFHNNFFQVGYNWGQDKGSLWSHLMDRSSFCVFQGRKHTPIIEFAVPNENVNKILNSISLNIEGVHYINDWDWTIDKDKSFKNLFIFNQTNNSGLLELVPQKSLADIRKYPITESDRQKILFVSENGKQSINTFFNRTINQNNGIPMFTTDENNIFKTINKSAVNFSGKRVLERIRGEYFVIHLEGLPDSRFNLILKNTTNQETVYE